MNLLLLALATAVALPFIIFIPMSLGRLTSPNFNIKSPRLMNLTGWRQRITWAHANALEALCYFTPAFALAAITQVDGLWCARFGLVFIIARLLHPIFYVCDWGWPRFAAWLTGAGASLGLVFLAVKAIL